MLECPRLLGLSGRTIGCTRMHTNLIDGQLGSCPASDLLLCWCRMYFSAVLLESSGLHLPQMSESLGSHLLPKLPKRSRCPGLGPLDASVTLFVRFKVLAAWLLLWDFEARVYIPRLCGHLEFMRSYAMVVFSYILPSSYKITVELPPL